VGEFAIGGALGVAACVATDDLAAKIDEDFVDVGCREDSVLVALGLVWFVAVWGDRKGFTDGK
jgi:hypothetical protein